MPDALDTCSWDLDAGSGGPRRPSLADMGGAQLEDDDPNPDPSDPSADPLNQVQMQIAAIAKVMPSAVLLLHFAAGVPFVTVVSAAGTAVDTSIFTVTDLGTGHTQITWPAISSPPTLPSPSLAGGGIAFPIANTANFASAVSTTNGIVVFTFDHSNAAADVDCTILVF